MVNETNIVLAILLSCFAMFTMVMVIIVFAVIQKRKVSERESRHEIEMKQKEVELLRMHIDTQEQEREKIARNIHDDVGPLVTALKLHLSGFEMKIEKGGVITKEEIRKEMDFVTGIVQTIRTTSHDMSPHFLLRNGLTFAFSSYIHELNDFDIEMESEFDEEEEERRIPMNIQVNCYRVLLEVVNNIIRHDTPTLIDVGFSIEDGFLMIRIGHNGKGMTNADFTEMIDKSTGLGTASLKSRTTLLRAQLDFQVGYRAMVLFKVPLPNDTIDQDWAGR